MTGRTVVDSSDTAGIVIGGGGPTGLGAAWRLCERAAADLDHADWLLVDPLPGPGGMARSDVQDGFVWDVGGHVLFPHYRYFDALLDDLIGEWDHVKPVRGAWMWGRFVPYPVQQNLVEFPRPVIERVLADLAITAESEPTTLAEFLRCQFGDTLYDEFFLPLNLKMWATEPSEMSFGWTDQRSGSASTNVPRIDRDEVLADMASGRQRPGWTDDTRIRYPRGGTGTIWKALADRLPPDRLRFDTAITAVDSRRHIVELSDGRSLRFDHLISSVPLDRFLRLITDLPAAAGLADRLGAAAVHVVGIGLKGEPPPALADVCSLYISDLALPFWRVTLLANYSRSCVPDDEPHWSLLCEVNVSDTRPEPAGSVVDAVIDGVIHLGFIERSDIVTTWHRSIGHGYPVPRLDTSEVIDEVGALLEPLGIICRGRFGGWRYEVSNQDHSFMQGLEVIDRLFDGTPEVTFPREATIRYEDGRTIG
jgi:protoporphyrinogen oxidase